MNADGRPVATHVRLMAIAKELAAIEKCLVGEVRIKLQTAIHAVASAVGLVELYEHESTIRRSLSDSCLDDGSISLDNIRRWFEELSLEVEGDMTIEQLRKMGASAFPVTIPHSQVADEVLIGATLFDFYAAHALASVINGQAEVMMAGGKFIGDRHQEAARDAARYAMAMLEERRKVIDGTSGTETEDAK